MGEIVKMESTKSKKKTNWKTVLLVAAIMLVLFAAVVLLSYGMLKDKAEEKVAEQHSAEIAKVEKSVAERDAAIEKLNGEIEKLKDVTAIYTIASKEVIYDIIESKTSTIEELATMECWYTNAARFDDVDKAKLFKKEVPIGLTAKTFTMKWEGTIKAGIDVDKIKKAVEVTDEQHGVITIIIPKARILSHEIDESTCEVLNEKDGLFNPVTVEDDIEMRRTHKEAVEKRLIENGVLEKAQLQAENAIRGLLYAVPEISKGYVVEFKIAE